MKNTWDLRQFVLEKVQKSGGWVNAHTHLDRAYTISPQTLGQADASLQQKWNMVDELKRSSTVNQIYDRMSFALEQQQKQGVSIVASFIDVDEVIEDKAMKAAEKLREKNEQTTQLLFINQTLKGVLAPAAAKWFYEGAAFADIIGGLPGRDKWFEEEHLDVLFSTALRLDKMIHVHVDQFNVAREKETELLVQKTIEYGLQGRVAAIHGISVAAQPYEYRRKLYQQLRKARIQLISCPTAWIDSRRTEELSVTHNSIAPVEELTQAGVRVALGTDNIADVYKPFANGDLWTELKFLLESCHYHEVDELVKIATVNGRKVLGIA